jgi:hypothetical protein
MLYKNKKEKPIKENIKDYKNHKILYELTKKNALHNVIFVEDKNDDWFVYVLEYNKKTGVITYNSMIIHSDCQTRLEHLLNCGYELKK